MKKLNAKGPEVLGNLPKVRGLPPKFFKEAIEDEDNVLIDTRMMLAFGGGHIKGALSIGGSPMLSIWAGWLLDSDKPILLFRSPTRSSTKSSLSFSARVTRSLPAISLAE